MAPYAAPIESRFNTTAFSGTSKLRNTASSSRKLTSRTAPTNSGKALGHESGEVDARRSLATHVRGVRQFVAQLTRTDLLRLPAVATWCRIGSDPH